MRPSDISYRSDNRSKYRSKTQSIVASLYKIEGNTILYTVTSSTHTHNYIVRIQLLGLSGNKLKSLKSALSSDIRISCSCPAFLYQGYKYITWRAQSGIEKETRAPDIRNPKRKGMACKHILVVLEQLKKDYSKIYSFFKEQVYLDLQKKNLPTDIKNNSKSAKPTEFDIQILTEFKDTCSKLYADYNNYLNNDSKQNVSFEDSSFYDGKDPSILLLNLSKPVANSVRNKFIGKCNSLKNTLSLIDAKRNGFNILLQSDISGLLKKINTSLQETFESFINEMLFSIIDD